MDLGSIFNDPYALVRVGVGIFIGWALTNFWLSVVRHKPARRSIECYRRVEESRAMRDGREAARRMREVTWGREAARAEKRIPSLGLHWEKEAPPARTVWDVLDDA